MDARVFERACSRSRLRRRLSWTWLGIDRGDAFDARVRRLRPSTSANGRGPRRRYVDAPKQRPGMGAIDKRRSSDQAWVRSTSAEAATRPGCDRQAPKQRPGLGAVDKRRSSDQAWVRSMYRVPSSSATAEGVGAAAGSRSVLSRPVEPRRGTGFPTSGICRGRTGRGGIRV